MAKIISKVKRFWFSLKLMFKISYQMAWCKQHWIDYIGFPMMCTSFLENLGVKSQVEEIVSKELDRLAIENGIEIQYCVTRGEEEVNFLGDKDVFKNAPMVTLPAEHTTNGRDLVVICMDTMSRVLPQLDLEHDVEKTLKGMVKHEFQHVLQYQALRKMGINITSFMEQRNKKFGVFELCTDIMEYDAHIAQYNEQRPIENFLQDFKNEYGAA